MTQPTSTNEAPDLASVEFRLKSARDVLDNESRDLLLWFFTNPDGRLSLSQKAAEIGIPNSALLRMLRESFGQLFVTLCDDDITLLETPNDAWMSRYGHYLTAEFQDQVTRHFHQAKQQVLTTDTDRVAPMPES